MSRRARRAHPGARQLGPKPVGSSRLVTVETGSFTQHEPDATETLVGMKIRLLTLLERLDDCQRLRSLGEHIDLLTLLDPRRGLLDQLDQSRFRHSESPH